MKRNKNSTSSSKNSTPSNGFKKDFSVKLPSSTPVASPRYGANPEKNSKEAKQKLVGNSGMTPSSSNLSTKAKSASAECPVPKPRKIVSNTTDDPSKDAEISETNQEVSSSGSYSLASDVSSTVEVRQPVIQEGSNLYLRFLSEEIHANQLEVPSFLRVPESAYSVTLRHAADEFSNSSHRLRVRDHAESVQLENLSIDGFFELLDGLFKVSVLTVPLEITTNNVGALKLVNLSTWNAGIFPGLYSALCSGARCYRVTSDGCSPHYHAAPSKIRPRP